MNVLKENEELRRKINRNLRYSGYALSIQAVCVVAILILLGLKLIKEGV